jgi:hypothetical protein
VSDCCLLPDMTAPASRGRCGRDRMWLDLQIPMQLVPITTKVVSSHYTLYCPCSQCRIYHCAYVFLSTGPHLPRDPSSCQFFFLGWIFAAYVVQF